MVVRRKDSKGRVLKQGESERKDSSYMYRWNDKTGKRHCIYAKTLNDLRAKAEKIQVDLTEGIKTGIDKLTINDVYKLWLSLKRGIRKVTLLNYEYMYMQYVYSEIGEIKLVKLKRSDIRRFYNSLIDEKNITIKTVECIHTVLFQVLNLAVEEDYLRANLATNALRELKQTHNVDKKKAKSLTVAQQKVFTDFLIDNKQYSRWYPIFIILLNTGLRIGELTGLTWDDIDFDKNIIYVKRTLVYYKQDNGKYGFAINDPKTVAGKRSIPMIDKVRQAFLIEKEYQDQSSTSKIVIIDGETNFVFINKFGGVQNQVMLNKTLRGIIRKCNEHIVDNAKTKKDIELLPKFSCHALRHTFATRLCEAGVNIKVIQDTLGHSDITTTMNIYTDATSELKELEFKKYIGYIE